MTDIERVQVAREQVERVIGALRERPNVFTTAVSTAWFHLRSAEQSLRAAEQWLKSVEKDKDKDKETTHGSR